MHLKPGKSFRKLLLVLILAANCSISHAQYIIEGAKYRSIRDSLLGNERSREQKDQINSISISGAVTMPGLYYAYVHEQLWQKAVPLANTFQGRKIKKMLVQHSSGKALIFLKGNDTIRISEKEAEKEGLLSKTSYTEAEIIKINSPLYIGDRIPVYIKKQNPENRLVCLQAGIQSTPEPHQYLLQSYLPGDVWVLEIGTDEVTKKVYAYHLLATEQNTPAPDFFVGEVQSVIADYNLFKTQEKIAVTDGYQFSGATLYFVIPGIQNVLTINISGPSLKSAKPILDMCLPGTTIMFDNVSLLDSSGKKIMVTGKSYTLVDRQDIREHYAELISDPNFVGGSMALYRYIIETLIRLPDAGLVKGRFDLDFTFMLEPDGTLTDIFNENISGKDKIVMVCHDLVKYSETWIPGTYNGEKQSMKVNIAFTIEIK